MENMEYIHAIDVNSLLNKLYHEKVQIDRTESKYYRGIAFENVEKILEYINKKDRRFGREPVRAGSYWQGLRVGKADEYDYSILLTDIGNLHWGGASTTPRRYGFNRPAPDDLDTIPQDLTVVEYVERDRMGANACVNNTTTGSFISGGQPNPPTYNTTGSFISGAQPKLPTYNTTGSSILRGQQKASTHNPGESTYTQFPTEPTIGYCFVPRAESLPADDRTDITCQMDIVPFLVRKRLKKLLTDANRDLDLQGEVRCSRKVSGPALTIQMKEGDKEMSIDFAPMIRSKLPFKDSFGWPRSNAKWPSHSKVQAIKEKGINLTAKKDFWWMYSFVEAEKQLVAGIDEDQGKRKETHRLMKLINGELWCPTTKPIITSYILKNVWFWEMESHPLTKDWTNDKIADRVLGMTGVLMEGIRNREIKQYFQPEFNLLASKDPEELSIAAHKISKFLDSPFDKLNKLMSDL